MLAHRGLSSSYPENTLPALRAALHSEYPAAGIELDVVFSRDGCPMVIHDETLDRTTSGSGLVESFAAAELQKFDAGSWFGKEHCGYCIPTLEDVLQELGSSCVINIEIKPRLYQGPHHSTVENISNSMSTIIPTVTYQYPPMNEEQLTSILALLDKYQLFKSTIVSSLDHRCLVDLRRVSKEINLAAVYNDLPPFAEAFHLACEISAFSIHLQAATLNDVWLEDWRAIWGNTQENKNDELGVYDSPVRIPPVLCWTVNDPQQMHKLLGWGASGVFSDHSDILVAALITSAY